MEPTSKIKVNMIVRRHGNHASVSGYDRIADYIDCRLFKRSRTLTLPQRIMTRALSRWASGKGSQWYGREDFVSETAVMRQWYADTNQIFHFVYGENSFRYTGLLNRGSRNNAIVCTYHAPPERFQEVVQDRRHMADLDAALVVSRVLGDYLKSELGDKKVHFIPHGVDTEFFVPAPLLRASDQFKCLFVGSHLRDFELLASVAEHFIGVDERIKFDVITLRRDFHYFDGLTNVTTRTGISDEELRHAYQAADLLLMPLKDATANNSLLEAMACGLPIVVTELPGVRDYVNDASACFVRRGDCRDLIQTILRLRDDPQLRDQLGVNARTESLNFSFEEVSAQTFAFYEQVLANKQKGAR